MHLLAKTRLAVDGGCRFGIVLNGSPRLIGGAGSGESEIRRYVLESDLAETMRGVGLITHIIEWRGKPCTIRMDNGPEYISHALLEWAEKRSITLVHIQPGQQQQSAYIERYDRTVRHEWLDQNIIKSIEEAQHFATQWLWAYNNDRPNMGIGGITPAQKLKMAA